MKLCEYCKGPFINPNRAGRGRPMRFCGAKCRHMNHLDRKGTISEKTAVTHRTRKPHTQPSRHVETLMARKGDNA